MDEIQKNSINPEQFCLKWSNYEAHVLGVLVQLLQSESLVDVTLCAMGGEKLQAHRIVLCAASPYFEEIFANIDDSHPVVILSEVDVLVLKNILEFVYHGELNVHSSQLNEVLKVASSLQIRGLTEVSDQLPCLISSNDEVKFVQEDFGTSSNPTESDMQPAQEISVHELVLNHFRCDEDQKAPNGSHVTEYETSVALREDSLMREDSQDTKQVSVEGMTEEIQCIAFETSDSNLSCQRENWDFNAPVVLETSECTKRKRRVNCRKEYSLDQLSAALTDLRAGHLLRETAAAHNIPRSTLYVRAKAEGIPIAFTRQEHSLENVSAAVQAVQEGASLQQASELFHIPKTVLWRRVKAAGAGGRSVLAKHQSYGPHVRQAAVQALQSGQTLSKVSAHFKIPKTTLFREKTRLIQSGKLSWTPFKKGDPSSLSLRHLRLKEAVAACKEGKMSQAVASTTFKVPKTTIWRRLRAGMQESPNGDEKKVRLHEITNSTAENEATSAPETLGVHTQFAFIETNGQLPVTYIVEEDFNASSLII